MSFFGFGKKDSAKNSGEPSNLESSESYKIIGNSGKISSEITDYGMTGTDEEKKKKLAKRIVDIGNKLDEISTQVYHLQQRVELIERKMGVKFSE